MRFPPLNGPAAVVTALVLLVPGVAGCSSQPGAPGAAPGTTPPAAPAGTTPRPGTTQPTPQTAGTAGTGPAAAPKWVRVLRQPTDGNHVVALQRRHLVTRASDDAGTTTITTRPATGTGRVVVRHQPASGFVAQSPVVIDDRWALIQDIRSEGPDPQINAYRYDLASGARQDLAKVKGLPRITEPELGAHDGTFAYTTTDSQRRSCLVVASLATLESRTVSCVADPAFVADPIMSADSVTFSEVSAPGTAKRCKRILTAALSGGPARPVAAASKCLQWSGATLHGATVWSEVAETDPDQYRSKAYVRTSAGAPATSLGTILTDTIVACGTWIHWEVRTIVDGAERYQVNRWRPGTTRPQRIYASPPDTALSALACQDGRLLVESAHLGAGDKYSEALVADAH